MSQHTSTVEAPPLDLSRWRNLPNLLILGGGLLAVAGAVANYRHFNHAWLLAFMFFLSLVLGALFLVIVHHLFDAGWSVPIRRFLEHIACLAPVMALLFLPILLNTLLARGGNLMYPWMREADPSADPALRAKLPLFTPTMFYVVAAFCFGVWWLVSSRLRSWSLQQDESGAAVCTHRMRAWASVGVFLFAITLSLGAIMWMKALQHQWFSTMYGVYYFAGSVWTTVATVYILTMLMQRTGALRDVLHQHQFYFLGSLLFAFTVFYAYITFSQYFIIWNANLPEETFWYLLREKGSWWYVGMILIFGHFFLPFLLLLRIDAKHVFPLMTFLGVWAWLMHFCDLEFNIMPVPHPNGFAWQWVWVELGCLAFLGGVLAKSFLRSFARHPAYPLKDPRLIEAFGTFHPVASPISGGDLDEADDFRDGLKEPGGLVSPGKGGGQ